MEIRHDDLSAQIAAFLRGATEDTPEPEEGTLAEYCLREMPDRLAAQMTDGSGR